MQAATPSFIQKALIEVLEGIKNANQDDPVDIEAAAYSDNFATALATSLDSLRKQANVYIASAREARNSYLLFHRLPEESLEIIMENALIDAHSRVERLGEYTCVSRFWYHFIHSTPLLWSRIFLNESSWAISKALSMSRSCPVQIHMVGQSTQGSSCLNEPSSESIQIALNNTSRWRDISLRLGVHTFELLRSLATAKVPSLEVLKIWARRGRGGLPLQVDLFGGRADRLQVLHLRGIEVPWTSNLLKQVRDLKLADSTLHPSQLLSIVQWNRNLVHLAVGGVSAASGPADSSWRPSSSITHRALQSLTLGCQVMSPVPDLLPYVMTPKCLDLSVAFEKQPNSGTLSQTAYETFMHVTRRVSEEPLKVVKVAMLVQTYDADRFHCDATFETQRVCNLAITIPYAYKSGPAWMQAAIRIMEPLVHTIEIALEFYWDSGVEKQDGLDVDTTRLFGQIPRVKSLSVRGCWAYEIMEMMARPVEQGERSTWLYAELDEFILDTTDSEADFGEILGMVRGRYGYTSSSDRGTTEVDQLPRRWKRLELPEWARDKREFVYEIRRMTGLNLLFV